MKRRENWQQNRSIKWDVLTERQGDGVCGEQSTERKRIIAILIEKNLAPDWV